MCQNLSGLMENVELKIESLYENVPFVCDKAKEFCMQCGMTENEAIKVMICMDEALNNVVKHSYKEQAGNEIEIVFSFAGNTIRIDIIDYGESRKGGIKSELKFDPDDIESLPEGGMGLFIIQRYMDATEYHSHNGKNVFTLFKKLKNK